MYQIRCLSGCCWVIDHFDRTKNVNIRGMILKVKIGSSLRRSHNWNKTWNKNCFISADLRPNCFISVLFQWLAHVKENSETVRKWSICQTPSIHSSWCDHTADNWRMDPRWLPMHIDVSLILLFTMNIIGTVREYPLTQKLLQHTGKKCTTVYMQLFTSASDGRSSCF